MLPHSIHIPRPKLRQGMIAATAALAMLATSVTQADAWGRDEQKFLKGAVATAIIGGLILHNQHQQRAQAHPAPQVVTRTPQPVYVQPAPVVRGPDLSVARAAFNEYSPAGRRAIQQRLAAFGYYSGPIDGVWGRGTAAAVAAYARASGDEASLRSRDASVHLLNQLVI